MGKQNIGTRVEFYTQAKYDEWLASHPDTSSITVFRAYNLPLVTVLPDLPSVTDFWAYNLPLVTVLPEQPTEEQLERFTAVAGMIVAEIQSGAESEVIDQMYGPQIEVIQARFPDLMEMINRAYLARQS